MRSLHMAASVISTVPISFRALFVHNMLYMSGSTSVINDRSRYIGRHVSEHYFNGGMYVSFGSPFSAVSKQSFATKSSFCRIFRALQDFRTFAPLGFSWWFFKAFSISDSNSCTAPLKYLVVFQCFSCFLFARPTFA